MFQVSAVFSHCTSVSTLGRRRVVYSDWQHLCVINVYRDLRPELTWTLQKVERGSGGQQGKDDTNQGNYRPTALTSSICKMMEQMINQSGFRRGRNSRDLVLCLEHKVSKAQIKRVVAVFFDIEKAYDMMLREGWWGQAEIKSMFSLSQFNLVLFR